MNQLQNFTKGFFRENPILVLVLGTCPTLATTSSSLNGLGMGIATTFVLVGSNVVKIGNNFRRADEISNSLQLPLYPIAYAVALSFFVLAAVLVCDILKISGGTYE